MWRLTPSLVTALLAIAVFALAKPAMALEDDRLCGIETARQEKAQAIPDRFLHAISLVESGRWNADRHATLAWPWTVTAEGEGQYLPSKDAAIAVVRKLQARGIRNIDVGCMQVNLLAHPDAFATLDEAFEPSQNVAYAAQFLLSLFASTGNWPTAGAWYHSQTPELATPYKAKLMTTWEQVRQKGDERTALASLDSPAKARSPLGLLIAPAPAPPPAVASSAALAVERANALAKTTAERAEAKRIADAYRVAKLEEYRQRKAQQMAKG